MGDWSSIEDAAGFAGTGFEVVDLGVGTVAEAVAGLRTYGVAVAAAQLPAENCLWSHGVLKIANCVPAPQEFDKRMEAQSEIMERAALGIEVDMIM